MKKILLITTLIFSSLAGFSQQKNWAVGAKLGDPSGLTVRKYLDNDENAIEVNVGVYGAIWGLRSNYKSGRFDGAGISFSGLYLWHNEMGSRLKNYYGFGGQITSRSWYEDKVLANGTAYLDQNPATGLGGLAQAGLEYYLPTSPLSIFMEVGAYVELIPAVLYLHPQGGAGVRLNF